MAREGSRRRIAARAFATAPTSRCHGLVFMLLFVITSCPCVVTEVAAAAAFTAGPAVAQAAAGVESSQAARDSSPASEAPQLASLLPVGSRTIRLPNRQGTRVRVFYPADVDEDRTVEAEENDAGTSDDRSRCYAPYATDGRRSSLLAPKMSGCWLDAALADASRHVHADVATASQDDGAATRQHWPMLLYSHAIGHNMDTCVLLFESLASRGIIVGALEHTDGTASPYTLLRPDGSERMKYSEYAMTDRQKLARRAGELLEAAEHLPKEMASWMPPTDPAKAGDTRCCSYPIVLGGNGFGGAAAVMAANGASDGCTVEGLLLHDPTLGLGYGMLPPNGAGQSGLPTVTYVSDQARRAGTMYGTRTLHIKGAKRGRTGSFTDALLWGALGRRGPSKIHKELVQSMTTFLWTRDAIPDAVAKGSLIEVVR